MEMVFSELDRECQWGLSGARYQKNKRRWANLEPCLQPSVYINMYTSLQTTVKEAYCVCGILSYARKYWRKALNRKTAGHAPRLRIYSDSCVASPTHAVCWPHLHRWPPN